jgi:hypothetical protein
VVVIDRLEVPDVEHHHGDWLAAVGRLLDEGGQVGLHVATVKELSERVGDRHLDRHLDVVAQLLSITLLVDLLLDLRAHAREHLVLVDPTDQIVVDPDLQATHQSLNRHVARSLVSLGGMEQRLVRIGLHPNGVLGSVSTMRP